MTEVQALQIQQNRAARIVLNLPPRMNREYMFNMLGWLTVQQLIVYHSVIAVFRIRRSKKPEYLAKSLTRDNKLGNIIVDNSKLGLYQKSFVPRTSKIWNQLPQDWRETKKIQSFKRDLKKWVFDNVGRFSD